MYLAVGPLWILALGAQTALYWETLILLFCKTFLKFSGNILSLLLLIVFLLCFLFGHLVCPLSFCPYFLSLWHLFSSFKRYISAFSFNSSIEILTFYIVFFISKNFFLIHENFFSWPSLPLFLPTPLLLSSLFFTVVMSTYLSKDIDDRNFFVLKFWVHCLTLYPHPDSFSIRGKWVKSFELNLRSFTFNLVLFSLLLLRLTPSPLFKYMILCSRSGSTLAWTRSLSRVSCG